MRSNGDDKQGCYGGSRLFVVFDVGTLFLKVIQNFSFNVDGPKYSTKAISHILNLDQQLRNHGINPGWKLTQDPPVAT